MEHVAANMVAETAIHHQQRFKAIREMHRARNFRLVFCANVAECVAEDAVRTLGSVVKEEKAKGGLDYLSCDPLIISEVRSLRTVHVNPPNADL